MQAADFDVRRRRPKPHIFARPKPRSGRRVKGPTSEVRDMAVFEVDAVPVAGSDSGELAY